MLRYRYLELNGSDHPDHTTQEAIIGGYIRWRNHTAIPKRNFAIGSKIRQQCSLTKHEWEVTDR